jgi:hypothetical protein
VQVCGATQDAFFFFAGVFAAHQKYAKRNHHMISFQKLLVVLQPFNLLPFFDSSYLRREVQNVDYKRNIENVAFLPLAFQTAL